MTLTNVIRPSKTDPNKISFHAVSMAIVLFSARVVAFSPHAPVLQHATLRLSKAVTRNGDAPESTLISWWSCRRKGAFSLPLASITAKEISQNLAEKTSVEDSLTSSRQENVDFDGNRNGVTIRSATTSSLTKERNTSTTFGTNIRLERLQVSSVDDSSSEIERFVSEIRELYDDLENGGGCVRRRMVPSGVQKPHAVSFTYVAPPDLLSQVISKGNMLLHGAWRLQKPTIYDANTDWKKIHKQIYNERKANSVSPNPPPLLLYLPGLDGFGISATAQFDDLASSFELWRMTVDKNNVHSTFSDLVDAVVEFVKDATSTSETSPREVILCGESFGGLLACAVAMALSSRKLPDMLLKGMVLVNPATSFDETNWERFVPLMTSLRYLETQEEIIDDQGNFRMNNVEQVLPTPYSVLGGLALAATIPDSKQYSSIFDLILRNVNSVPNDKILSVSSDGFRILAEYLPAVTLERRVTQWLPVGTSVVNNPRRLANLHVPTLIVAGNDDNMLPTKEEADRLGKLLPDCVKMNIPGAGHFVLDARVNLTEVLIDSHIDPLDFQKNSTPHDPITDWKLPPDHVLNAVIQKRVEPQRKRTCPVFFSTDSITGKRRRGLSLLPSNRNGPLLIVGNHQLFGQDLGMIISQLIEERHIVARGLAHPIAFSGGGMFGFGESSMRTQKRRWEFIEDSPAENDLYPMFGAVKVSPRNYYRLLQTNQTVLLFPGGAREALHGKEEAYQLFWPEKTDFVRVAARFNATIVPLSAIGAADSINIVADAPDLLKLPFGIGENLANFSASTTPARYDADNTDELLVPPLALPKAFPARHYFLFGRAFDTSDINSRDKEACQKLYDDIKKEVKHGIDSLLQARKDDPYALNGMRRTTYQRLMGKNPPTFPLTSLPPSNKIG